MAQQENGSNFRYPVRRPERVTNFNPNSESARQEEARQQASNPFQSGVGMTGSPDNEPYEIGEMDLPGPVGATIGLPAEYLFNEHDPVEQGGMDVNEGVPAQRIIGWLGEQNLANTGELGIDMLFPVGEDSDE